MVRCSICIPTYNSARYLDAAISSALAQTCDGLEVVVCDNASTDETSELCRSYTDPRFRYVRFSEPVGQAANWNRCLDLAEGEFVTLLHADDVLLPEFAARAVALFDAHPKTGMVHCAVRHIDQTGSPLRVQALGAGDRAASPDLLRSLLLKGCVVNPAGVMVRRSVYDQVGRFTEEIVWGVDWHMWARIALRTEVGYLSEVLAEYRQHPSSGTTGVMATARNGVDELWMMEDLFRALPPERTDLRALQPEARRGIAHRTWCFAEEMCRAGFPAAARAGIRRAVAIHPPMLLQGRVGALWAASYLGYDSFQRLHRWKRRAAG